MVPVLHPSLFRTSLNYVGNAQSHGWCSVCTAAQGARSSIDGGNISGKQAISVYLSKVLSIAANGTVPV